MLGAPPPPHGPGACVRRRLARRATARRALSRALGALAAWAATVTGGGMDLARRAALLVHIMGSFSDGARRHTALGEWVGRVEAARARRMRSRLEWVW